MPGPSPQMTAAAGVYACMPIVGPLTSLAVLYSLLRGAVLPLWLAAGVSAASLRLFFQVHVLHLFSSLLRNTAPHGPCFQISSSTALRSDASSPACHAVNLLPCCVTTCMLRHRLLYLHRLLAKSCWPASCRRLVMLLPACSVDTGLPAVLPPGCHIAAGLPCYCRRPAMLPPACQVAVGKSFCLSAAVWPTFLVLTRLFAVVGLPSSCR